MVSVVVAPVPREVALESLFAPLKPWRNPRFAGLGDAAAVAGEAVGFAVSAAVVSFLALALAFGLGVAVGDSAAAGEASCFGERFGFAVGEAVGLSAAAGEASALAERLCFAGDGLGLSAGDGLCAKAAATVNANRTVRQENFFIAAGC